MKKIMSGFIALAMALPLGMTGTASALPRVETSFPSVVERVQTNQGQFPGSFRAVDPDRTFSPWAGNVERRIERRMDRRWDRDRRYDRRWDRDRDRRAYYRGYRGYRDYRPGYRRYDDGFWYPAAAFITGAIVGGAIASQPRAVVRDYGSSHVQWCYDRYRSYRASDNTFQPYNGPRRQCRSPYY